MKAIKRVTVTIDHCDSKNIKNIEWVRKDQVKDLISNFFKRNEGIYIIEKNDLLKIFNIPR